MNKTNITQPTNYCKFFEPDSSTVRWLKFITLLLFIGLGLIGNVFVIVLAVKYTVKRSLHLFIINVVVADILFDLGNLYSVVIRLFRFNVLNHVNMALAIVICKTHVYFFRVVLSESLLTLLIISVERYRATSQTVLISRPLSRKRGLFIIACSWIFALAINSYLAIFKKVVRIGTRMVCIPLSLERTAYTDVLYLISMTSKLIFCLAMVVVSILTLRRLSRVYAIESSISEYQKLQRKRRIKGAVKMVLYSLLLSSSWFIPLYTLVILRRFTTVYKHCIDWKTIQYFVLELFPIVNICLNPCIYCVCLTDFRKAARRLLCCNNRMGVGTENTMERATNHVESTRM